MSNTTNTELDSKKINRFNGQYLKCVVTNYESTMTILKNSGTLIVHRPLNEDYNYLYLGNEFLSSGYGQKDIKTRDTLAYLANTYNDIVSYMLNSYSYSLDYIEEDYNILLEKLKDYVEIDGGNISYTTIVYPVNGGEKYKTTDIIMHGPEADYTDLSISNIVKYVNTFTYENELTFPVGEQILNVELNIGGKKNDSGGVSSINFNFNHLNSINDSNIYTGKNIKVYSASVSNNSDEYTIRCSLLYDKNMFYFVNEGKNVLVNKIDINVAKTPSSMYKNYPKLEERDIEIVSDYTAIKEHSISLDGITIIGKHTISLIASVNDSAIPNDTSIQLEENSLKPSNYYKGTLQNRYEPKREYIDDDVYFDISPNTYMISFVVPNRWKAYEVYFIEDRTGIVHNWTGAVKAEYSTTSNENINLVQIGKSRYVQSDRYTIIMTTSINEPGKLLIRTYDTGKEQNVLLRTSTLDTFDYSVEGYDLLYNENFTSIYWLTYNDFSDKNIFKKVIRKLNYNGTK